MSSRQAAITREFERLCQAGLVCWHDTDPAVATLVQTTVEPVYHAGEWHRIPVHKPVCEFHLERMRTCIHPGVFAAGRPYEHCPWCGRDVPAAEL